MIEIYPDVYHFQNSLDSAYIPSSSFTFSIPVNRPFLLEKAIVEIPFSAGDGWFRDRTFPWAVCKPVNATASVYFQTDNGSDAQFGGPGITFSLKRNYDADKI